MPFAEGAQITEGTTHNHTPQVIILQWHMLESWSQQEMSPQILLYFSLANELCAFCHSAIFRPAWKLSDCTLYIVWSLLMGRKERKKRRGGEIKEQNNKSHSFTVEPLPPSYSCMCGNHNPSKWETNNEQTLTCHKLILSI